MSIAPKNIVSVSAQLSEGATPLLAFDADVVKDGRAFEYVIRYEDVSGIEKFSLDLVEFLPQQLTQPIEFLPACLKFNSIKANAKTSKSRSLAEIAQTRKVKSSIEHYTEGSPSPNLSFFRLVAKLPSKVEPATVKGLMRLEIHY